MNPAEAASSQGYSPLAAIGHTPLVELTHFQPKPGVRIFAKLEGQNPSGSIKDRVAWELVSAAEARGELQPGQTIVEASSGNTAIALAMVARQRGYKLHICLSEDVPEPIFDILRLYKVQVETCKARTGMKGAIDRADQLAEELGAFALRQFFDPRNVAAHYHGTGNEIVEQLREVDAFIAGIGTGGTIMGVGQRLREHNPDVTIVGVEPKMGDCLQGLCKLEEGFHAPLLDRNMLSRCFLAGAADSISLAKEVARKEGLIVGVSSGAALHVAQRIAKDMSQGNIVLAFSDGGWKYLPARPWHAADEHDPSLNNVHWW